MQLLVTTHTSGKMKPTKDEKAQSNEAEAEKKLGR
jgi:hypothetical protein